MTYSIQHNRVGKAHLVNSNYMLLCGTSISNMNYTAYNDIEIDNGNVYEVFNNRREILKDPSILGYCKKCIKKAIEINE